jgi:Amt family ammonium transporter
MITGFIYPIIAHWVWHPEGWLSIMGFHDFAGSAVVHLTGAVCALVGCVLMGPRIGRFDKKGRPVPMPGHSVPLSALGGLILIFGFFACNGTKQGSISNPDDGIVIATAIVNTALGTSAAGLATLIFNKTGIVPGTGGNYSFLITMNGSLTGTVALCAGCNVYPAWAAVIIGALSGPLYLSFNWILLRCQIDDPLDAIPVHGGGGIWGTLAVYLFKWDGILMSWTSEAAIGLGWNIIGLFAIVSWTGINCFFMFFTLKKMGQLRVEPEQEFKGMDLMKHGESAYPADAWVEAQYMKEDAVMSDQLTPDGEIEPASKKNGGSNSQSRDGLPPNMRFSRAASYNDPHQMFPSASKLFSGMTAAAGNITKQNMAKSSTSMTVVNEGEEGTKDEKERLHVIHELAPVGKDMVAVAVAVSNNSMSSTSERNENTYI